jgi:hypothetical protein
MAATAVCWGVIAVLTAVAGWRHPRSRHVPRHATRPEHRRVRERVDAG